MDVWSTTLSLTAPDGSRGLVLYILHSRWIYNSDVYICLSCNVMSTRQYPYHMSRLLMCNDRYMCFTIMTSPQGPATRPLNIDRGSTAVISTAGIPLGCSIEVEICCRLMDAKWTPSAYDDVSSRTVPTL
jgi:hypothetical protein